ncbi:helix-turn-helix domain-containing protein [Saccharothrix sp.]|uniref:TetR/AcrR family transcriptional regulator n=1 Tax=Saccharothrix sp. TaxID=1873460 RepID=UPI0028128585|nr:helix-turn-helix domain-containing protein [Saccharothrix sp.]
MAAPRPLRADAQRNRDKLIAVALEAFSADGEVALETVAKRAGVGIGTLYRHFPTREALVEAVYRSELAKLCDAVPALLAELPPEQAMRAWMDRFVDYMGTKQGMGDALKAVIASGADPFSESRRLLLDAVATLLDASGDLGEHVRPMDVLGTLGGVALAAVELSDREQAARMLDLVMDGLRYRSGRATSDQR